MIPALLASAALAGSAPDEQYARLEQLYTDGEHQQTIQVVRGLMTRYPDDPELYWMLARAYFAVGELHARDNPDFDKDDWYTEMLRIANAGLELSPGHGHLLFARGGALARLGTTRGITATLFLADDIESAWLTAARDVSPYASIGREEVLPCDIYVTLGIFYRVVPDWWLVEMLTGTRGSMDDSLDWLNQAYTCSPDRINVVKELAVSEVCAGQRGGDLDLIRQGLDRFEEALQAPIRTEVDKLDQQHVQLLLADPTGACGYSRDGQLEEDRDAIKDKYLPR